MMFLLAAEAALTRRYQQHHQQFQLMRLHFLQAHRRLNPPLKSLPYHLLTYQVSLIFQIARSTLITKTLLLEMKMVNFKPGD